MPRAKPLSARQSVQSDRWIALVAAFENSKLTMRAFAAQHGVNASSLSWWRRRLRVTPPGSFVEQRLPLRAALSWVSQTRASVEAAPTLRLELPHLRAVVSVPPGTDLLWLRDVLGALS